MVTKDKKFTFAELGSLGGKSLLKKKGKSYFKALAKKSVAARKKKAKSAS